MTSQELKQSLQNPATSYWLLNAIKDVEQKDRDVLDQARDADILRLFCTLRLKETQESFIEAV